MTEPLRRRLMLGLLLAAGAVVFFTGINWGLPSRDADEFLFGRRPAWSGREIMQLAGEREEGAGRGANVPSHLLDRSTILWINRTDPQRAEIVRRYRLYTNQPDEMTVLMALRGMGPGKGYDPRFYQYGGLFIYPVGAMLRAAGAVGLIQLTPSIEYYLDHPEAFGRFYVVARCYAAIWGLVGVWVVFHIARRLGLKLAAAAVVTLVYIAMPVVINMTHEAKPHLPGAVLTLIACLAAARYVDTGKGRWSLTAGALCGAALGMVLSGAWSFAVLPVMAVLRRAAWRERVLTTGAAVAMGIVVYCATNPYVPINLVRNHAVLQSNLGNSTEMYHVGGWRDGVPNALRLTAEGASLPVACVGAAAAALAGLAGLRRLRACAPSNETAATPLAPVLRGEGRGEGSNGEPRGHSSANGSADSESSLPCLLAAPALLTLIQFFALAAGKPGEYARFAVLPDIVLALAAVAATVRWCGPRLRRITLGVILLGTLAGGASYLATFIRDCGRRTSRTATADRIWQWQQEGARSVAVWAEPAPYSVPPVDLFTTRLWLLPPGYLIDELHAPADIVVQAVDVERRRSSADPMYAWWSPPRRPFLPARMSWADKPFEVGVRKN